MKTKNNPQISQMNADKTKKGAVLNIGMHYYFFKSPAKAAQAFALLSQATHVRKLWRCADKKNDTYHPQELIGGLDVTEVPFSDLRESAKSADSEKKECKLHHD